MSLLANVHGRGLLASRPAAAAANEGYIYYSTDTGSLHRSNGSSWDAYAPSALVNPMTTTGDTIYSSDGSGTPARRAIGTSGFGYVSEGGLPVWAEVLPWHVPVTPMVWTPDATTGTWVLQGYTDQLVFPFYQPGSVANSGAAVGLTNSGPAVNDAIAWDLVLAKGTWDCHLWVRKSTNTGIVTLNQDGVSQGTVDTYAAAAAAAKISVTGFTVASTGKKRMQLLMATKNGSSSGFVLNVFGIEFRRTA